MGNISIRHDAHTNARTHNPVKARKRTSSSVTSATIKNKKKQEEA